MTRTRLRLRNPVRAKLRGRSAFPAVRLLSTMGVLALAAVLWGVLPVEGQTDSVPAQPTGLTAVASHDSVALSWDDPGDASITHYRVYRRDRSVDDVGVFHLIESDTGSAATTYTDGTVQPEGSYVYRVKAVNSHGASDWSKYARADTPAAPLAGFTLVDASDQSVLATLSDGVALTLSNPDTGSFGIRVETDAGASIGSVRLELSGQKSHTQTEGITPYSLYGDDADGLHGEPLPVGSYTLKATAYSQSNLQGDALDTLEVSFTVADANSPAVGAPAISGTARAGETLTANTDDIADADGLDDVSYDYQWLTDDTDIEDATGSSYDLTSNDVGKTLQVRVSFTDDAGNKETLTSGATAAVEPQDPSDYVQVWSSTLTVGSGGGGHGFSFFGSFGSLSPDSFQRDGKTVDVGAVVLVGSELHLSLHPAPGAPFALEVDTAQFLSGAAAARDSVNGLRLYTWDAPSLSWAADDAVSLSLHYPPVPPDAPTGLEGEADKHLSVSLKWADPEDGSITGYRVKRMKVDDDQGDVITLVEDTESQDTGYEDQSVQPSALYNYVVLALVKNTVGEPSMPLVMRVPPAPPEGLEATAARDSVTLTWDDPGDDTITGYVILRDDVVLELNAVAELIEVGQKKKRKYVDGTVAEQTTYEYQVVARNAGGEGGRSDVEATTPGAPISMVAMEDASLSGLSLTDFNIGTFSAGTTVYGVRPGLFEELTGGSVTTTVTATTTQALATMTDPGTSVAITPGDADAVADGHQVVINEDLEAIEIVVTAADGATQLTYTVNVERPYAHCALRDFDVPSGTGTLSADDFFGSAGRSDYLDVGDHCNSLLAQSKGIGDLRALGYASEDRYGRFYCFVVERQAEVKIELSSDGIDSLLALRWWGEKTATHDPGDVMASTGADSRTDTHAITRTLVAGVYVVEASTYWPMYTGPFTLRVSTTAGEPAAFSMRDASLSALTLTKVDLTAFDPGEADYERNVAADVTHVTVDATAARTGANVDIAPADSDTTTTEDHEVALEADGRTEVVVTVTAQNGVDARTYTVALNRVDGTTHPLSSDSSLSALGLSGLSIGTFASATTEYTYSPDTLEKVLNGVTTTVSATPTQTGALVTITPADDDPAPGHQIYRPADQDILVTVTPPDGLSPKTTYVLKYRSETFGDASLSGLTLSGINFGAFESGDTYYTYSLNNLYHIIDEWMTTVTATPTQEGATVSISPADADENMLGHQVVRPSEQQIRVTVTPPDRISPKRTYMLDHVSPLKRDSSKDLAITVPSSWSGHLWRVTDIWSDGEQMWAVLNNYGLLEDRVVVFDLDTGQQLSTHSLESLGTGHDCVYGLWSDGATAWGTTGCEAPGWIHAYDLATWTRTPDRDIEVPRNLQLEFRGLTFDGNTLWAARSSRWSWYEADCAHGLYAYDLASLERVDRWCRRSTDGMTVFTDVYSDGRLIWVMDLYGSLRVFELGTWERRRGFEWMFMSRWNGLIDFPRGLWSDGRTMWFSDSYTGKVFAFSMPESGRLRLLKLSGVDFGPFLNGVFEYEAEVANDVSVTTVTAERAFTTGSSAITIDAAGVTTDAGADPGHQVNLSEGENVITITVTAPDGVNTETYTVTITRAGGG